MSKSEEVKNYFNNTDTYLKSNIVILLRKRIISAIIGEINDKNIIDIGCGNGELSKDYISQNKITFLDISPNMIKIAKKNVSQEHLNNASFVNADFSQYRSTQKFDIVLCIGVVAHVDNILDLFTKLKEITTENGLILLQFTASEKIISKFNQLRYKLFGKSSYNDRINVTSSADIKKILNQAGLKIEKKINYFPVSPLFTFFGYKQKIKMLEFAYKNKLVSKFGSEVILCLSK